eukprot:TRINITY_DN64081_c0_g1_i2.p1 TRINITY_DN64081_c0_g1~~TRINITY_DN64081_c0_g1_i2.p1  ORF type:complete len:273 (+),score=57.23 TRINITY_DN64081_c0_g1_i2:72-890(+)
MEEDEEGEGEAPEEEPTEQEKKGKEADKDVKDSEYVRKPVVKIGIEPTWIWVDADYLGMARRRYKDPFATAPRYQYWVEHADGQYMVHLDGDAEPLLELHMVEKDQETVIVPPTAAEKRAKWSVVDSLVSSLRSADVALIKGSWLLSWAKKGQLLPRRQDMPEEALWDPGDLIPNLAGCKALKDVSIVCVCYQWLTAKHPDPEGRQLARLRPFLEKALPYVQDLAILWDWGSMFQMESVNDETDEPTPYLKLITPLQRYEVSDTLRLFWKTT